MIRLERGTKDRTRPTTPTCFLRRVSDHGCNWAGLTGWAIAWPGGQHSTVDDTNEMKGPFVEVAGRDEKSQELAEQLVDRAKTEGLDLVGPDGVLTGLTKRVLEAGLEAELTEHLGYDKHAAEGRDGGNSRTAPARRRC